MTTTSALAPDSSSSPSDGLVKGCKLVLFLIVAPFILTAVHLGYTLQRQGIILVEALPQSTQDNNDKLFEPVSGIYWKHNAEQHHVRVPFQSTKLFGLLPAWPSISQIASSLANPTIDATSSTVKLQYAHQQGATCFLIQDPQDGIKTLCPVNNNNNNDAAFQLPPLSEWQIDQQTSSSITLRIRSFDNWFSSYYFQMEEKPFQQLAQRPATCLLLALNVGLAYAYWNFRVSPNAVALMDGPMRSPQYQYWRAYTGSLAHFEWWHLLFNMMSLHGLGQFLELEHYGSIPFLFYNMALIPLTVLIFLAGTQLIYWIRVRYFQQQQSNNTPVTRQSINAVGYSGVLFAWSVVASLEQTKSCPIPFFTETCFETWHLTQNLKFNIGPWIQLAVAQVILPRVSLGGHLAGVVAGFLLHWQLFPLELMSPAVMIPFMTLMLWYFHRQCIPVQQQQKQQQQQWLLGGNNIQEAGPRNFLDVAGIDDDDDKGRNREEDAGGTHSTSNDGAGIFASLIGPFGDHDNGINRTSTGGSIGIVHVLWIVLCALGLLSCASVLWLSWKGSLFLSQGILLALFFFCYQAYTDCWGHDDETKDSWASDASQKKQRMLILWKGFITCCVVVLVTESMTLASWMMMGAAMVSPSSQCLALLLLGSLLIAHLLALCVACRHWEEIGGATEEKGPFEYLFGFCVLDNAKVVGRNSVRFVQRAFLLRRGTSSKPSPTNSTSSATTTSDSSTSSAQQIPVSSEKNSSHNRERKKTLAAAAAERRARGQVSDVV
ncbi:Rhomboid domain containing [Seminavis robusta]|uniref:Rhomboid domain containing n=1 Tax=Seminavis robusta TaxID=568900 RepID=A0A9N8D8P0_9STRA|nr:Rhomboid domain containing [Seminavis robusta]|eukprot:Sro2_g001920.1 Rhomboid domain containing (773) ;mRNA; f:276214-278532